MIFTITIGVALGIVLGALILANLTALIELGELLIGLIGILAIGLFVIGAITAFCHAWPKTAIFIGSSLFLTVSLYGLGYWGLRLMGIKRRAEWRKRTLMISAIMGVIMVGRGTSFQYSDKPQLSIPSAKVKKDKESYKNFLREMKKREQDFYARYGKDIFQTTLSALPIERRMLYKKLLKTEGFTLEFSSLHTPMIDSWEFVTKNHDNAGVPRRAWHFDEHSFIEFHSRGDKNGGLLAMVTTVGGKWRLVNQTYLNLKEVNGPYLFTESRDIYLKDDPTCCPSEVKEISWEVRKSDFRFQEIGK